MTLKGTLLAFVLSITFVSPYSLQAAESNWHIKAADAGNTLVIGDIHADAKALLYILKESGAMTKEGAFTRKYQDIVFVGDLVGKGKQNIEVLDILMDLEMHSKVRGPRMHFLLGNHEVWMLDGHFKHLSNKDLKRLKLMGYNSPEKAFGLNGRYGRWLSGLNTMVQIGPDLISHAGFGGLDLDLTPQQINESVRGWLIYLQGGAKPKDGRSWLIGLDPNNLEEYQSLGPIWTHAMAPGKKKRALVDDEVLTPGKVDAYLKKLNAEHIIVGHNPTPNNKVILEHKKFGESVILIDTGISSAVGGNLGALSRIDGELKKFKWDRPDDYPEWIKDIRNAVKESISVGDCKKWAIQAFSRP